ncbi:MAG: DEAD/DEAH box helicase, partial [Nitrospira sp.]
MSPLQTLVDRLARPIDFASRNGYARLDAVRNLGPFISRQVIMALAEKIYSPVIETHLLALRQLFTDFDPRLDREAQRDRLQRAQGMLTRLRQEDGARLAGTSIVSATPPGGTPSKPVVALSREGPAGDPIWTVPIQYARGVGPKRALLFEKLGVGTLEDLLWLVPWRYEDRAHLMAIGTLAPGVRATICGEVTQVTAKRTARRGFTILDVTVSDPSGSLQAVYFNQPYLEKVLRAGTRVMMNGTATAGHRGWMDVRMEGPQYEVVGDEEEAPIHVGRIVPIYHETKGLTSRQIRAIVKGALDHWVDGLLDVIPEPVRLRHRVMAFSSAIADIHFPKAGADPAALDRGLTPAHRRLAFEEFFVLQLALAVQQQGVRHEHKGIRFLIKPALLAKLQSALPFSLTSAQREVLADIQRDMASTKPMHRLIQGDVGSGKTVVALHAMVIACGSGYQAALMAPTEILAEQHFLSLRSLLEGIGV